jgi:hypothetical protein
MGGGASAVFNAKHAPVGAVQRSGFERLVMALMGIFLCKRHEAY